MKGGICYTLLMSKYVTRLYQAEGVTPEITAVFNFMASLLGADCAGDKDLTFLTLRVGNKALTVYLFNTNFQFQVLLF